MKKLANAFDRYILDLRKTAVEDKTEHTDRAALQALLQAVADDSNPGVSVQHEPKRVAEKGAPDFKITRSGLIIGYVENKGIGEPLDKVLKSDQIAKYKTLSENIIVTDYLHFAWINKDGIQRETLCHATDLESRKFHLREDRVAAVLNLLQGFFSTAPEGIGRAQPLALALARRSQLLRDFLTEELVRQERDHREGRLYGLFQIFRDQVFHDLTLKEFADAFAQMLAYGLFLARLNSGSDLITLHNAREYVPGSFRLIRELVDFLTELNKDDYRDVRLLAHDRGLIRRRTWSRMAQSDEPKLFDSESQGDLFGAQAAPPAYRPDPDKVRARLHKILTEARAAQTLPWEPSTVSLYQTIFPQMAGFLPDDEGAQLCFQFESELERLKAA